PTTSVESAPPFAAPATPETGSAPAPDPSATHFAHVHPSRSSKTRTTTLANQPRGFMQACRKDTVGAAAPRRPARVHRRRLSVRVIGVALHYRPAGIDQRRHVPVCILERVQPLL